MNWDELKKEFIKDHHSKKLVHPERRLIAIDNIEKTFKTNFPELIENPKKMLELGKEQLIEIYDNTKDFEKINMAERWVLGSFTKILSHPRIKTKIPKDNNAVTIVFQASDLIEIIAMGENKFTEFKSSFRYDTKKDNIPKNIIEHSSIKTVAAFLNVEGGQVDHRCR